MKRITITTLVALLATFQLIAYTAQEAVDMFVSHSSLRYASVGVQVIDLDSAMSIASYRPNQANITASTMKTVVSSAALGLMGPHFRFETPVYLDGEVKDGHFKGYIVIRGMGDPTLGSIFLPQQANIVEEILDALRARGINSVEGSILGDDSYYAYPFYEESWDVGDLAFDYGTAVHGLSFHDNLMTVNFSVDSRSQISKYRITPPVPGLKVVNRLRRNSRRNAVSAYLDYSTPALVLTGEATSKSYQNTYANPTPAPMLVDSVEQALYRSNDIRFQREENAYEEVSGNAEHTLLVLHKSPELTEIITSLLDRSDNMFAHALLRAIGARDWELKNMENMPPDLDAIGVAAVKRWLEQQGINTEPLFMRDGSGLARANKASVNFFGDMLSMMAHRRFDGVRLCDLMPKAAGRAGKTLKANALSDAIVLKSGSMRHVQCYVGYYPANEPRYAFAVLVNNFTCSQASIREQIGTFLCNLFEEL